MRSSDPRLCLHVSTCNRLYEEQLLLLACEICNRIRFWHIQFLQAGGHECTTVVTGSTETLFF